MDFGKWLKIAAQYAPVVLSLTSLAPIAAPITAAIAEAEQIQGATGAEKLQHVTNIAVAAATVVNTQAGKTVLDPTSIPAAVQAGVSGVVTIINGIHKDSK